MCRSGSVVCMCIVAVIAAAAVRCESATVPERPHVRLREVGFLTGYGIAPLKDTPSDYEIIPLLPRFGFDITPCAGRSGAPRRAALALIVEPLLNLVINPETNVEFGTSLLLQYSVRMTKRIEPFIEAGVGAVYTTQHTREQGTQCNFLSQAGAGVHYFLSPHVALTGSYRYRHLSNAGISKRNDGINHHLLLLGMSWFRD